MPDNEPYVPPMVLQPVPGFHNQPLSSSSSESETEGETDTSCKPKIVKPLKGILKKPKMTEDVTRVSDKWCNDIVMPNIDMNEKENPKEVPLQEGDSVFKEALHAQSSSICDNISPSEVQSDNPTVTGASPAIAIPESANKVPFDSQVKPKRGILKRKGKFSTGDSGCDLTDSSRKDSVSLAVRPMDLSEADSALESPDGVNKFCPPVITTSSSSGAFTFDVNESQTDKSSVTSDSVPSRELPRRRGILKNTNSDKRLSACSTGSNSSADILDFSYDSSDDILAKFYRSQSKNTLDVVDADFMDNKHVQDDLFNYAEAREVCKKALEICQNFESLT